MPDLTRRAFLRGAGALAPAAIVAPYTPLWASWLRDEMRKLTGQKFWVPPAVDEGLPIYLNGGDIVVTWGSGGVFEIVEASEFWGFRPSGEERARGAKELVERLLAEGSP